MKNEDLLRVKDIDQAAVSYMNSIKPYTALKKEEERKLIIDYKKNNNINARNKVINSNLKYTCSIANSFRGRGVPFSMLISEANDALMYAIEKFDVNKDTKLISYARWWIWQRVKALVEDKKFDFNELPDERREQINENNDEAQETAKEYHNSAFRNEETKVDYELIKQLCSVLNERELDIINMYYGCAPYEDCFTLEEIGKKYDITKERARQIIEKSKTKMRSEAMLLENKTW